MSIETIKSELLDHLKQRVKDEAINADNYEDAHHHAFNEDYYIIGYYQAEQWLKSHDMFWVILAISMCIEYERDHFGEVLKDYDNAETTVNMLAYVLGNDVMPAAETWREFVEALGLCDSLWASFKVTYAIDNLDPNPTVEYFEEQYEAEDYVSEEIQRRVDHIIQHSTTTVSDDERAEYEEVESTLVKINAI